MPAAKTTTAKAARTAASPAPAKRAAPTKRPPRKAPAAPPAAQPEPEVVADTGEPAAAGETGGAGETGVPFRDRTIRVKPPTAEQLTIYKRLLARFQELQKRNAEDIDADEALKHFDRAIRVVTSVMVDQADKDWLEDELLEGNLSLSDCFTLLTAAFHGLQDEAAAQGNRQARRAAGRKTARLA